MVTIVEYLFLEGCCFGHWKKVAMTLKPQLASPNHNWESTLTPMFEGSDILSVGNLASFGRILKKSISDEEEASNPKSGSWNLQIHFVWDILLDRLFSASNSKQPLQGNFPHSSLVTVP